MPLRSGCGQRGVGGNVSQGLAVLLLVSLLAAPWKGACGSCASARMLVAQAAAPQAASRPIIASLRLVTGKLLTDLPQHLKSWNAFFPCGLTCTRPGPTSE